MFKFCILGTDVQILDPVLAPADPNFPFQHGGSAVSPEMGQFFVCLCFKCYSPTQVKTSSSEMEKCADTDISAQVFLLLC